MNASGPSIVGQSCEPAALESEAVDRGAVLRAYLSWQTLAEALEEFELAGKLGFPVLGVDA